MNMNMATLSCQQNMSVQMQKAMRVCRGCLSSEAKLVSLLERPWLCRMIMAFCSVQIKEGDGLPAYICPICIKDVKAGYNFKKRCEQAEKVSRQYISAEDEKIVFDLHKDMIYKDVKHSDLTIIKHEDDNCDISSKSDEDKLDISEIDILNNHPDKGQSIRDENDSNLLGDSFHECDLYEEDDLLLCKVNPTTENEIINENKKKTVLICNKVPKVKIRKSLLRNCSHCDFKTKLPSQLKIHMNIHTGEKPLACEFCNFRCIQLSSLQNHKLTHTNEKPYDCCYCVYKCTNSSNLKRHIRSHTNEKPYSCHVCSFRCAQSTNLKEHLRIHSGEKPFLCDQCHYTCRSISALRSHKNYKHSSEKQFSCDECNFKAKTKSTLTTHKKRHCDVKKYSCDLCPYTSIQMTALENHTRMVHTGERPYACDQCPYRCVSLSYLKMHKRSHLVVKMYSCDKCTYSCNTKFKLKIHNMTHTGEKPYICSSCDFKCLQLFSLKRHVKRNHNTNIT